MNINLDRSIKELLLQHDCVILPGLGGFIANYKPATFDVAQRTALPPSRQILFNPNLVHNDGLLYAYISRETHYGYKEVQAMAEVYFKTILYEVKKGLKFTVEDLGYFFLNKARKIEFVQETTDNLLLDSYGLSYLNYKEFTKIPDRSKTYQAFDDSNPVTRQRKIRRWVFTGAAACLVTAMILVPVKMGYINLSSFDLNPADSFRKEQAVQEPVAGAEEVSNLSESEPAAADIEPVQPDAESAAAELPPPTSYHIIVGSFRDIRNAEQLKQNLAAEGFGAEIIPGENSFYRVSASQYPVKSEAITALSGIRNLEAYKSAWILTR